MFNNTIQLDNLINTSYVSGNILFYGDLLYTPVLNYVKQINLATNKSRVLPFQTHNHIRNIVIHPQGIILIAIDMVGYAIVFNLKGMFQVAEFNFKGTVSSASFSDDGKLFCITQSQGFLVYECPSFWRTFQPFLLLKKYKNRHADTIITATFSPDSRFLITSALDNLIYINNLFPIPDYIAFTLQVHRYKIIGTSYSKNMKYIYSIDTGSNIYVWKWVQDNLTQGYLKYKQNKLRKRNNFRYTQKNHLHQQITNQQDNQQQLDQIKQYQYFSDFQKNVNKGRYILATKLIVTQPGAYLKRYYYQNNTGFLVAAYSNGKFTIYKLLEQQLTQIQTFSIGTHKISSICVNESCTWIALAIKQIGQIIVWQWKSQTYILSQKGLIHDSTSISSFINSKYIATGTTQGQVNLWQKASGFSVATFCQHEFAVTDLKFSNATTLFSCSFDGKVHAYDAVKYRKFRTYQPDNKCQLLCLTLDEAGQLVFAGAFDPYEVYGWNVQTANILQIIRGHEGPVSCISLSGDYLLTGSWDKTIKIHQIYSRKLNVETLDHGSQITALAFHPQGKSFAVATIKGQIYIWRIQDSQLLGIIDAEIQGGRSYFSKISAQNDTNTKYLKTLAYSQCGKYLIGGGKSRYLYYYDIDNNTQIDKIQLTINRDIQGVLQKLNSKYIKEGQQTYQLTLQQQQYDQLDEGQKKIKLPGSKKIDISQIRNKLQVDVRCIVIIDGHSLAVCSSFGVFIYGSSLQNKYIFNPYSLDPTLTPQKICKMLELKNYSTAIEGALDLNLSIKKIIRKIPMENIKNIILEINFNKLERFMEKLVEGSLNFRECCWVDAITKIPNLKIPDHLLLALGHLSHQVSLLRSIQAKLQMSQILSL